MVQIRAGTALSEIRATERFGPHVLAVGNASVVACGVRGIDGYTLSAVVFTVGIVSHILTIVVAGRFLVRVSNQSGQRRLNGACRLCA